MKSRGRQSGAIPLDRDIAPATSFRIAKRVAHQATKRWYRGQRHGSVSPGIRGVNSRALSLTAHSGLVTLFHM